MTGKTAWKAGREAGLDAEARAGAIRGFLASAGWPEAALAPLAQDASFRRYWRVRRPSETAVLMDAPPDRERTGPYLAIARHLRGLGFSAPAVLANDTALGLLLLEDLGEDTFTRLLADGADEPALYRLAVDVLIALHASPFEEAVPAGLSRYDDGLLAEEADLLIDWYAPCVLGRPVGGHARAAYRARWKAVFEAARGVPETLVLRDYHVDNLMRLPDRQGIAACGLLDFQDAVTGPVSYDFVSLVADARRDLAPGLAADMRGRYLAAFPGLDAAAFDCSCAVLGAQRHCKVLGIFTRLCLRDGKPGYLDHIPRVWRLLETAVSHPRLAPIRDWLDRNLPPPMRIAPRRGNAA